MKIFKIQKVLAKHLFLNLSDKCNLDCGVCYGHLLLGEKTNMSLETAQTATDFYYTNRDVNYNYHYIMFFGGEPLLNFDIIPKYLDWFKEKYKSFKCNFFLFTNGILLEKQKTDYLLSQNIGIFISYDNDFEYFSKHKNISEKNYEHITDIIKYACSINPEMIIPYYIIHDGDVEKVESFYNEMHRMGLKKVAVTREIYTKWDNKNNRCIKDISFFIKKNTGLKLLIYPEILGTCVNCSPHNIMIYPNGDIFDLCLVSGSSLHRLNLIQKDDLSVFYMGNIYKDSILRMDISKKKNMIQGTDYKIINSHCPTITANLEETKWLWED